MSPHRVLKYEATTYHVAGGSSSTTMHAFTQAHASEVGVALEPDGLAIEKANELLLKWNKRGQRRVDSIRYSYRLPLCQTPAMPDAEAIELAAQDIWMSIRKFNGHPDQVRFAGYA